MYILIDIGKKSERVWQFANVDITFVDIFFNIMIISLISMFLEREYCRQVFPLLSISPGLVPFSNSISIRFSFLCLWHSWTSGLQAAIKTITRSSKNLLNWYINKTMLCGFMCLFSVPLTIFNCIETSPAVGEVPRFERQCTCMHDAYGRACENSSTCCMGENVWFKKNVRSGIWSC